MLPSSAGGPVTTEVGFLEAPAERVGRWLADGIGEEWELGPAPWTSFEEAVVQVAPAHGLSREAVIPVGAWSLLLNNTRLGTDVGVIPSLVARELGSRGIRAVCVEDGFPATILEVFGPDGEPPLLSRRSIAAADDGGRWVFETGGEPYPFEQLDAYRSRRKRDRFTCRMLHDYLRELGVPIDAEPDWAGGFLIEKAGRRKFGRRLSL